MISGVAWSSVAKAFYGKKDLIKTNLHIFMELCL